MGVFGAILGVIPFILGLSILIYLNPATAGHIITLPTSDRSRTALSDYSGNVVLVHFWATWCAPCKQEMPELVEFYNSDYQELKKNGLRLLVVSNDVRRKDLAEFLDRHDLPFPVYFDSLSILNDKLDVAGVPASVLVDRHGRVVARHFGILDWDSEGLFESLEASLGDGNKGERR